MAGKRTRSGPGEGSIRERENGLWEARVRLDDGRRKSLYGKTRQEVARKLAKAVYERNQGLLVIHRPLPRRAPWLSERPILLPVTLLHNSPKL